MGFQILALDAEQFSNLPALDDTELARLGVERHVVDAKPGYPCRVSLLDCDIGDTVLLLNYEHQPANSPYRSSHAIFIREGASTASIEPNQVPEQLRIRTLSVRAFDKAGMMLDAEVIAGDELEPLFTRLFESTNTEYLHVHNAARGCFAATVVRA